MFNRKTEPGEPEESGHQAPEKKIEPDVKLPPRTDDCATIGESVRIRGDVSGEEDLLIRGKLEGSITLKNNIVTIGKDGSVNATINAKIVRIEGTVEGELSGSEQIIVTRTGNVRGNIAAPRVSLEDGCRFKGSIDMDVDGMGARDAGSSHFTGKGKPDHQGPAVNPDHRPAVNPGHRPAVNPDHRPAVNPASVSMVTGIVSDAPALDKKTEEAI